MFTTESISYISTKLKVLFINVATITSPPFLYSTSNNSVLLLPIRLPKTLLLMCLLPLVCDLLVLGLISIGCGIIPILLALLRASLKLSISVIVKAAILPFLESFFLVAILSFRFYSIRSGFFS